MLKCNNGFKLQASTWQKISRDNFSLRPNSQNES